MSKAVRAALLVLCGILFLFFLLYTLSPWLYRDYLDRRQKEEASSFLEELPSTVPPEEVTEDMQAAPTVPYEELLLDARSYNSRLLENQRALLQSPDDFEGPVLDLRAYGLEKDIFGVLSIPAIDLEMPVYLGASKENLSKGAAQLSQTSLPIGGDNTHCVLGGHRGWKGAAYFLHVPELQPGDRVILTNLWGTLTYEVTEIAAIDASDIDAVLIQPGKDLLSLLTCRYSGGEVRDRYFITCQRVAN